ncbi:zinc finger translocation-associated protein [Coregonus clupeaformis]|uniref:zinc finger translocation-associated protein n=1 Tax=Coregonus clupeaformis TaxID=59861 RepID=UPI001E1C9AE3|nr:zinc finger translocation-associated protein [Coregonus clupeaformis]
MEEKETGESEPVVLPCAEQTDSLSLIIRGEEEATQERSDLGHCSGEEDDLTNGHVDGDEEMVTPLCAPGTSYWSVTEGPDSPFLLSPVPGPSGSKERVQRASRPGFSRIPGRDHRRYYHEYWRSEFLMDFDPRRHGMICMVCGSSLATLKLSTIKRHIRQKHPDSLLWSVSDKEVIRSGWESHLSLEGGQSLYCPAGGVVAVSQGQEEELLDCARRSTGKADGTVTPKLQPRSPTPSPPPSAPLQQQEELSGPSAQTLERYLNDSLHAWFRQEFLMEYQAEAGRLVCMVCGRPLPSLHLDHIKSHVLDIHPQSLVYSSEEKHCILQTWAQTHESDPLNDFIKSEPNTKDEREAGVDFFPDDLETIQIGSDNDEALSQIQDMVGSSDGGGVGAPEVTSPIPPLPLRQPRKRRLRGGFPWRLRLDYLVAYGPQGRGTFCMVCSQALPVAKVSSFRRHIQECHPETTSLSREERAAMAEAWTKEAPTEDHLAVQMKEEVDPSDIISVHVAGEMGEKVAPDNNNNHRTTKMSAIQTVKKEEGVATIPATLGRHGHYPGKDQRRNYQARWRVEFLMDYDCRRHGLICMVCGATLATLKVSTIKRHIQQVHPHSLEYGPDERQQALLSYNQTALHFVHSEDCFSSQDHGHSALKETAASLFVS